MPGGLGIHHVALKTGDFDRSVTFYEEGLGLKHIYGWGEGDARAAMLDAGNGSCIEVFAGGSPGGAPEGSILHIALRSTDPDADYDRAMKAGATSQMVPTDVTIQGTPPARVRIAFVKGPDGEVLEFFQSETL